MQGDLIDRALGYALVRAFRRVNRATNRLLRPLGLSAEQAHILLVLWLKGPMKIGQLQRYVMLSSATLTGAIDRMERSELIKRVADPSDRRAWRLEAARFDSRKQRAVEKALASIEAECFSNLDGRERGQLFTLLERVRGADPD
jgi:DNA-binding MarR family transcriptional regulator